MAVEKKEASIIEIIQEMVKAGESEEKIVSTLKQLGVEPAKAKRLLLLGQADTFALLKSEISKIVDSEVERQKPLLEQFIANKTTGKGEETRKVIEKIAREDLATFKKKISVENKAFREHVSDGLVKVAELGDRLREKINTVGLQVGTIQKDMDEMKVRGVGGRSRIIGLVLILAGVSFCAASLYFFYSLYTQLGGIMHIDSMIITVVMALIGVTMLFAATTI